MAPASRAACFEAGTCYALWAISDDKWADPVLNYVLTQSDQYPFGEERRLFYVSVNYRKTNDLAASKKPIPPLFSCFFLPLLFRTRGRSSTRGQSTGLTFPRSVGRAFKPNSFMLQAALKSRSWCVPHLGQIQLRSFNFNPLYTWPHLPQVFELGAKRPVLMRFTPYQLHLYSSSVRNIPKDASPTACAK